MESALSPREIQTRIRSGESVEDVARVAGMDTDRVERFAAPVIAEREHVARLAMTSSARRRGETSSHRTLRGALNERLLHRGVDIDSVRWDSHRMEDGRWAVTAEYLTDESQRQALFYFDLPGRYSIAGNDEARWALGDVAPSGGTGPSGVFGAGESDDGTEATVDLSDELALVRAIQDVPVAPIAEVDRGVAEVLSISRSGTSGEGAESQEEEPEEEEPASGLDALNEIFASQDQSDESAEPTIEVGQRGAAQDVGPSDASAVPELSPSLRASAWEPAIVVDYPVEPSEDRGTDDMDGVEIPEGSDDPGRPEPPVSVTDRRDEASTLEPVEGVEPVEAVEALPIDVPEPPTPAAAPKPARRKRASVPSWDEIVFGSPKEK